MFHSNLPPARPGALVSLLAALAMALVLAVSLIGAPLDPVQAVAASSSAVPHSPSLLKIDGLGKGTAPLDGAWQFHLGDNPAWASPNIDDTTGHDGWEQITADGPWGTQTHPNYTGYAWYRRHVDISIASGASQDLALLVPAVDEVYEFYWNGQKMGHFGSFAPQLTPYSSVPAQTYGLGPVRSGVLAFRVFKVPLASNDDGTAGGFEAPPIIGSPDAIAAAKDAIDYHWLRSQQFRFGLTGLYALASLLSLFMWLRDRSQKLIFWMMVFTFMPALELLLNGLRFEVSLIWLTFFIQASIQIREVSQWFLLIFLLQLFDSRKLIRTIQVIAVLTILFGTVDGFLGFLYTDISVPAFQIADAILTFFILPGEIIPALLVVYAVLRRKRLDFARWLVAIFALVNGIFYSISNIAAQGVRFTHWTLANVMTAPHFTLFGSVMPISTILRTALFLSILFAVMRYAIDYRSRQAAFEQEFENARELQRVLVPETFPSIPGFTLTSAYKPDRQVGGDFFQIISLEQNATLIVLGDVSGKGLRAAMAVSLIVGAIRTLADTTSSPAEILRGLNRHLHGRLQGGFATCIAVRLDPGNTCVVASAGHPGPYLNGKELELPGALPVGLAADTSYVETRVSLEAAQHFALFTDGLLEARNATGELYGFRRMTDLFSSNPTAAEASDAAIQFGQNDDITVLTLTRLGVS